MTGIEPAATPADDTPAVTTWGPPAEPKPAKPRQASLWDVAIGYFGVLFLPSLILLPTALYMATQSTASSNPDDVTKAAEEVLSGVGPLLAAGLLLQWAVLLGAVWLGGRKTEGGWRSLVHWTIRWRTDLPLAAGFVAVFMALQIVASLILTQFGINTAEIGNTGIITSSQGVWLAVMVAGAVIGAPLVEELFFRGLFLNVTRRKWGTAAGVIISSVFFGLIHIQPTLASTVYTVTGTTIVGAGLALLYVRTSRLGTVIAAHVAFNAVGVGSALLFGG